MATYRRETRCNAHCNTETRVGHGSFPNVSELKGMGELFEAVVDLRRRPKGAPEGGNSN